MTDKELINGCLKNDRKSQKALFDKYANKMKSVCLRYSGNNEDAEDILQDGFILVFKNLQNFKHEGALEGWIYRIMMNTALRFIKKKKNIFFENIDNKANLTAKSTNIESQLSTKELMDLLLKLPDGYRAVFNMYVIEGYSHKEIGKILDIKESTSRSQLAKAKIMLRSLVAQLYNNDE